MFFTILLVFNSSRFRLGQQNRVSLVNIVNRTHMIKLIIFSKYIIVPLAASDHYRFENSININQLNISLVVDRFLFKEKSLGE